MRDELVIIEGLARANMLMATVGIIYCCVVLTYLAFYKRRDTERIKKEYPIVSGPRAIIKGNRKSQVRHTDKTLYELSQKDEGRY